MSRYCTECGAAANDLGPFCAKCGGRVRSRAPRPATAVGARRTRPVERIPARTAAPPAARSWDEEFAAVEPPVETRAQRRAPARQPRPAPVRPALASEVPLALAAVAIAGLVLGLAAWLLVLRPSSDVAQPAARSASHAAAGRARSHHTRRVAAPKPAIPSDQTQPPGEGGK
jgi:hypothetical protein